MKSPTVRVRLATGSTGRPACARSKSSFRRRSYSVAMVLRLVLVDSWTRLPANQKSTHQTFPRFTTLMLFRFPFCCRFLVGRDNPLHCEGMPLAAVPRCFTLRIHLCAQL